MLQAPEIANLCDVCSTRRGSSEASSPLWARLEARQLNKPVFNVPPPLQTYPDWHVNVAPQHAPLLQQHQASPGPDEGPVAGAARLEGTWDVSTKFEGFAFPSTKIEKQCAKP